MNSTTHHFTALLALLALSAPASAVEHFGNQAGVWKAADSPHVIGSNVLVPAGQTLTIEPGSLVLARPGTVVSVAGSLVAEGTASQPVRFASSQASPAAGDWLGLLVRGGGSARLVGVGISHATTGLYVSDHAQLEATALSISDSLGIGLQLGRRSDCSLLAGTIERSGSAGIFIEGGAPLVSGCTLRDNGVAVQMNCDSSPVLLELVASGDRQLNGVLVNTTAQITWRESWTNPGLPYVIRAGGLLRVEPAASLAIASGALLKFGDGAGAEVAGVLSVGDDNTARSLLTSLRDDAAFGDTNQDGNASVPGKGDWNGIDVLDGGQLLLTGTELRLGDDGVLVRSGASASLVGCELHDNTNRGLAVAAGGAVLVESSSFHDNDVGLLVADTAGIAVGLADPADPLAGGNNSFHCNDTFDVENRAGGTLVAHRNFWGSLPPDPARNLGSIDSSDFLAGPPAEATARARLLLRRLAVDTLRFEWTQLTSCAQHQLLVADLPTGPFGPFAPATDAALHDEAGGMAAEGRFLRCFRVASDLVRSN